MFKRFMIVCVVGLVGLIALTVYTVQEFDAAVAEQQVLMKVCQEQQNCDVVLSGFEYHMATVRQDARGDVLDILVPTTFYMVIFMVVCVIGRWVYNGRTAR